MVIMFVKFQSMLEPDAVRETMEARAPQFRAQRGLVQKYYAHEPATGEWSGVYFWESPEALAAFRDSDLARSIPTAYQVRGAPRVEVLDVLFPLRATLPGSAFPTATGRGTAADARAAEAR